MSEKNNGATEEQPKQKFGIHKLFLKDLSFESPQAPDLFIDKKNRNPQVNLQINTETRSVGEDLYEVVLNLTATAGDEDQTLYLVEAKQAGLFVISGFEPAVRDNILGSHCPATLFPFAREVIASLVAKGGFPQLMLEPINFELLYAQHRAKAQQTAPAPTTPQ